MAGLLNGSATVLLEERASAFLQRVCYGRDPNLQLRARMVVGAAASRHAKGQQASPRPSDSRDYLDVDASATDRVGSAAVERCNNEVPRSPTFRPP